MFNLSKPFNRLLIAVCLLIVAWEASFPHAQAQQPTLIMPPSTLGADYFDLQGKKIFRWNDNTRYVMVHIENGSHLPGWHPHNTPAVQAAFHEWEQAMDGRFRFLYLPSREGSDITVSWKPRAEGNGEGDRMGVNKITTWGKYVRSNNIELALAGAQGNHYSPPTIQTTALHEIGHSLGIQVHSDDEGDIMFASTESDLFEPRHLTARDVQTMHRIYETKGKYVTPEGYRLSNFEEFQKKHGGRKFSIMWMHDRRRPRPHPPAVLGFRHAR